MAVENFEERTEISAPILKKGRELSLEHAQRCSFLIMEQSCVPLAVEIVPGKHCVFSTYLAKRERELSLSHAQRWSFLIMKQCCGPVAAEIFPGNTANSAPILPRERELSLAHRRGAVSWLWNRDVVPWQ
jgi:hypothetical protein